MRDVMSTVLRGVPSAFLLTTIGYFFDYAHPAVLFQTLLYSFLEMNWDNRWGVDWLRFDGLIDMELKFRASDPTEELMCALVQGRFLVTI